MKENPPTLLIEEGETLYLGKRNSDTSVCMYTRRGPIRVELRLTNRGQVTDLLRRIAADDDVGPLAAGLLRRNLVFVKAGRRRKDHRKLCQWWLDFLGNAEEQTLDRHRDVKHRSIWYAPIDPVKREEKQLRQKFEGKHGEGMKELIRNLSAELSMVYR
jgi:hypothetical protein